MRTRTTHIALLSLVAVAAVLVVTAIRASAAAPHNPAPVTTPYHPKIDSADLGRPIDNPYLPLKPGTVFRYRGVGDDGKTHELNIVRVTHRKKRIMGAEATVVLDRVWAAGKPEEKTFDWYSQDKHGNVWYLGENSFNYEHGHWVRDDGSWTAGVGNGQPGVIMLAHPRKGDRYRQEYSPGHAVDQAKVLGPGGRVVTPFRTFDRTLLTREYSTIDKQFEKKWYARGIGVIEEDAITKSKEHSELVSVTHRH